MGGAIVGWILIGLGVLFVLGGLASALLEQFVRAGETRSAADDVGAIGAFLKAVTELLNALAAAPRWLALTLLGLVLIAAGLRLVYGAWPL